MTFRRTLAALLFAAMTLAAALAVTPQLHAWLHSTGDRTTHQCAATLLSSGSVEHTPAEPIAVERAPEANAETLPALAVAHVLSFFGGSSLEHAPPAQS